MSQTLPADLYDPVLALEYTAYKFYENLSVMGLARAGGPIRLNANNALLRSGGTVLHAPVFKPISSLVTQRDLTSSSDATPLKIDTRDDKGVRISAKIGPVSFTKSAQWLSGLRGGELESFFAVEALNKMNLYIRNYVLGAAVAAITNMTSSLHTKTVWDAASRTNLSTGLLAQIRALLADRADAVSAGSGAAWVMRSESFYTDLTQFQLGQGVQGIADRASAGMNPHTLGMDYAIADDAALTTADAGYDKYRTLLMGPGCIELDIISLDFTPAWMNPKAENVEFVLRGDVDFELRIPGFQWDNTNGGTNPNLTAASLSTNWDVTYSDHREILLAMGVHNYSGN
jgi:hypothetical protein